MVFEIKLAMPNIWSFTQSVHISQEKVIIMAGIIIFSIMGSFVLWGPTQSKRRRTRSSAGVNGLVNMGETCFLNTLLQAIAASPFFCEWLEKQQQSDIAQALLTVVHYVNDRSGAVSNVDIPHFPRSVVAAMSNHGWSMGVGQQDSHELFFALMSCLEEQTTQPSKPQDILIELGSENSCQLSNASENVKLELKEPEDNSVSAAVENETSLSENQRLINEQHANDCKPENRWRFLCRTGGTFNGIKMSQQKIDFPFRGQQLSQLSCTVCSTSSAVQHQAFDCISLALPTHGTTTLQQLLTYFTAPEKVHEVQCDHCTANAGEPVKTSFVKQLSIGRLPKCLCFHIQRTAWLSDGQSYKRHDFVSFPEVLVMDKFTYCYKEQVRRDLLRLVELRNKACGEQNKACGELNKACGEQNKACGEQNKACGEQNKACGEQNKACGEQNNACGEQNTKENIINCTEHKSSDCNCYSKNLSNLNESNQCIERLVKKHEYRLQAVVVHLGEVSSGHFITYRKPPPSCATDGKWVYVSDEDCHATNLAEVLCARAYMLFYEKC